MAQQIKVNSSTGNIQIQISRGAIGPSTTANVANTANNLNAASTANVIIGGGVANYVLSTDGAGNTSWVAQTGGGATNPAGSNTQVQFNDQGSFGAESTFTYDKTTDVLTVDHFSGEAGNLSNVQGANISGEVSFAATANAVALANVAGAGNIASVNLDGNVANVLAGDGTFIAAGGGATVPGGSNTQVQYNDNGAFAGEAGFEYNDVTNTLTVDNISANITGTVIGDVDGALLVDVYNNTGVTLNKGDAVYLTGGNNGDNPHVALADADDATKMPALGIVKENIATATVGQVTTSGVMNDSSHGYTLGADLYVSTTPGQLTTTIPTSEANGIQKIGKVVNSNQIIVQGAFRTNQTPNLDDGNIFIGNATNQATTANLYGEINTHLAAFGSNTITTTGNVETGNLEVVGVNGNITFVPDTEIINGNRFVTVNRATETVTLTAGSFLIGERYTIVTTGTTDFTLIGAGSSVTAGSFSIGVTYTIISTGSTDFTLIGAADNNPGTTFTASGIGAGTGTAGTFQVGTTFVATGVGSGTGTAEYDNSSSQAFITDNYTTQGITNIQTFANTAAGQLAKGPSINFNNYQAIGNSNTDPLVGGAIGITANPTNANLANATTGTVTSIQMGGPGSDGFLTAIGSSDTDAFGKGAWKQFQYRPRAMEFFRRSGDADAREGVVANDEVSLNFYMASNNAGGGSSWESYPAVIAAKADPTFSGADNAVVPTGLEFQVTTAAFDRFNHTMYANGDVVFNSSAESYNPSGPNEPVTVYGNGLVTANAFTASTGNITATSGQFVGDGGGLSNISVSAGSQIVNGTSNVSVALDGNVTAGIAGTADMLVLSTDGANVKNKVFIDNADGNVLLDPNVAFQSDTFTNITRGEYDGGASLSSLNTAIVTDNYAGTGKYSQIMYANTAAGQTAQGPIITFEDTSAIGNTNTDPYVTGQIEFSTAVSNSNRAATSTATHTSVSIGKPQDTNITFGGITIDTGSNLHQGFSEYQTGSIQQYQYQNRSMEIFRQRGNAESPEGVQAGDEAKIHFYMSSNNTGNVGSIFYSYSSSVGAKVDPGFSGNPLAGVPTGVEIGVTNTSFAQIEHNFYGNGDISFNTSGGGTPVTIGYNGVITGDGGGLSNVSATATPGGFNDTIQFNNGGTLDGNSSFQFLPGTTPQVQLIGTSGSQPADLSLQNGVLTMYTEDLSGGKAPMAFTFHNDLTGFVEPINYKRTRGTFAAQTAVQAGDQIKNERLQAYSGATAQNAYGGGQTSTVQANDGLGNIAVTTTISTARPANGPNSLDKILFDTEFTHVVGNIQMDNTSASFVAGRIRQIADTFSNLTASPVTGERAVITDGPSLPATFGTVVSAGGGSQVMPVFWDGSDWRMG